MWTNRSFPTIGSSVIHSSIPVVHSSEDRTKAPEQKWTKVEENETSGYGYHSDGLSWPQKLISLECWSRWMSLSTVSQDKADSVKPWKPATLRALILGSFIIISVLLICILEVLAHTAGITHKSVATGVLVVADSSGNFSSTSLFVYLYLPTLISVCYSMLSSWVDLDVKQLEP